MTAEELLLGWMQRMQVVNESTEAKLGNAVRSLKVERETHLSMDEQVLVLFARAGLCGWRLR